MRPGARLLWAAVAASVLAGGGQALGRGAPGDGGPATKVVFPPPEDAYSPAFGGLAVDSAGNLYLGEAPGHLIRKVDRSGRISTVAGTGKEGLSRAGSPAANASIFGPEGLAVDSAGDLYIAEGILVQKVDRSGKITTVEDDQHQDVWANGSQSIGPATSSS